MAEPVLPVAKCRSRDPCATPCAPMTMAMNNEAEKIRRAARNFIDRFGKEAPERAKRRADELRDAGNSGGYATWLRICDELSDLIGDGADKTDG